MAAPLPLRDLVGAPNSSSLQLTDPRSAFSIPCQKWLGLPKGAAPHFPEVRIQHGGEEVDRDLARPGRSASRRQRMGLCLGADRR